jgi:hypothetical protein
MKDPMVKRADFKAVVDKWFEGSIWEKPVGLVAHTHHSRNIDPKEFYYNVDPQIDITARLSADFNEALVVDGVIVTIHPMRHSVHSPLVSATYSYNIISYKATMQMIMDTTIDPELYPSLLI